MVLNNPEMKGMIPLKDNNDPYSVEIRSKIKGSASQRRKDAQLISAIPRMNPETIEKMALELVADPNASAITIMKVMTELINKPDLSDILKINLLKAMCTAHQTIHGIHSKNINMNLEVNQGDLVAERVLKRVLEQKRLYNQEEIKGG